MGYGDESSDVINFIVHQYEIDDGKIVNIDGEGYAGIFNNANSLFLPSDWHQQLFCSTCFRIHIRSLNLQEGAVDLRGSSDVDDVLIGDESDNKLVGVRGKDIIIEMVMTSLGPVTGVTSSMVGMVVTRMEALA